jgi:hypothetical protein
VPDDFFFALNLPGEVSPRLVHDLVVRVCDVACFATRTTDLVTLIEEAVARAASQGACEIRFQRQRGELAVTVHVGDSRVWQTSRPID